MREMTYIGFSTTFFFAKGDDIVDAKTKEVVFADEKLNNNYSKKKKFTTFKNWIHRVVLHLRLQQESLKSTPTTTPGPCMLRRIKTNYT